MQSLPLRLSNARSRLGAPEFGRIVEKMLVAQIPEANS